MHDPRKLMRHDLAAMAAYQGVETAETLAKQVGLQPKEIVKLTGNENPYGVSDRIGEALLRFNEYHIYPDPGQRRIREALAEYAGVEAGRIVVGSGSGEFIDLLSRLFISAGDTVIEPSPTFGMYSLYTRMCRGSVISVPRDEMFEIDISAVRHAVQPNTKIIWVTSPNNPTGNLADQDQIEALLKLGPMVIVDEAYYEFSRATCAPLLSNYPNLVILRTMSKWAAIASFRIGYGLMDPEVARVLLNIKLPYNITTPAEIALLVSLENRDDLLGNVRKLIESRERLFQNLNAIPGIKPFPSCGNFILFQVPVGRGKRIYDALTHKGVFLRYFPHPRLLDCIRITVGFPWENEAAVKALRECIDEYR